SRAPLLGLRRRRGEPTVRWARPADGDRGRERGVRAPDARRSRPRVRRTTRIVGTLLLTGAAVAYLVWKIDLGTTVDVLRNADVAWFALAVGIMVGTVPALAFRWGRLLRAHGVSEPLSWLTRAYFVAYTAGQILPTSLGGDAVRVVETVRRNPGRTAVVTGTVVLERGLGGAATVVLGAIGFGLSVGRDRARCAHLLRDGAVALPRVACTVHAQRLRGARGLLRQLPGRLRRRRRSGVRCRLSLLPPDRRPGAARRRRHDLGGDARRGEPAHRAWLAAGSRRTRRSSSSRTTRCPGSSAVSKASLGLRRSSSTAAPVTARSRPSAPGFRT